MKRERGERERGKRKKMINQMVDLLGIARGPNKLKPILKIRNQP